MSSNMDSLNSFQVREQEVLKRSGSDRNRRHHGCVHQRGRGQQGTEGEIGEVGIGRGEGEEEAEDYDEEGGDHQLQQSGLGILPPDDF